MILFVAMPLLMVIAMPHGTYLITVPLGYATLLPYLPRILGPSDRVPLIIS
jgi:hypothetical protein